MIFCGTREGFGEFVVDCFVILVFVGVRGAGCGV